MPDAWTKLLQKSGITKLLAKSGVSGDEMKERSKVDYYYMFVHAASDNFYFRL